MDWILKKKKDINYLSKEHAEKWEQYRKYQIQNSAEDLCEENDLGRESTEFSIEKTFNEVEELNQTLNNESADSHVENKQSNRELKERQLSLNSMCKACELMKQFIHVIFDIRFHHCRRDFCKIQYRFTKKILKRK